MHNCCCQCIHALLHRHSHFSISLLQPNQHVIATCCMIDQLCQPTLLYWPSPVEVETRLGLLVAVVVVEAKRDDLKSAWAHMIMQVNASCMPFCHTDPVRACYASVSAASNWHALGIQITTVRQHLAAGLTNLRHGNMKKRSFWEVRVWSMLESLFALPSVLRPYPVGLTA